jgi:hypothetical protein
MQGVTPHTADEQARARLSIPGFHTFAIRLTDHSRETVRRIEAAIPLAKEAGQRAGCERLVPWLLEAIQHAFVEGLTEEDIREEILGNLDYWHARMHDGISAEDIAREAALVREATA